MLAQLIEALDSAQSELAEAEVALLQATARQQEAANAASRLQAAVAALSGEPPSAATNDTAPPSDIQSLSPEEFDKERKKRQRAREKEAEANNPLAQVKCAGCGTEGSLIDTVLVAPSGVPLRVLECRQCRNQIFQ